MASLTSTIPSITSSITTINTTATAATMVGTTTTTTTNTNKTKFRWTQENIDKHHAQLEKDKANASDMDLMARAQARDFTVLRPIYGPIVNNTTTETKTNNSTPTTSSRASSDGFELSVAPMMAWTNRHYRFMARLLTKRTLLYTEMICCATILNRKKDLGIFLGYDEVEHPIAIQLGGADPEQMKESAIIAEAWGYDEIDINVGCPSDKVAGQGCFGASLMLDHGKRVSEVVKAVLPAVNVPVTIKCRLGADDVDKYEDLVQFVETLSAVGVTHFIVHARKCLLSGLSPTQNRTIPPLKYNWVYRIAREYPHLEFSINGGITTMDEILEHRNVPRTAVDLPVNDKDGNNEEKSNVNSKDQKNSSGDNSSGDDSSCLIATSTTTRAVLETPLGVFNEKPLLRGVMIGRAAYQQPWLLSDVDRVIYNDTNQNFTRREIVHRYIVYGEKYMSDSNLMLKQNRKSAIRALLKPIYWMFKGVNNGGRFRNIIEKQCSIKPIPDFRIIVQTGLNVLNPSVLDTRPNPTGSNDKSNGEKKGLE